MKKSTQRIYLFFNKKKKIPSEFTWCYYSLTERKKKKKEGRKHKHENMPWIQTLILSFHLKLKA